MNIIKRVRQSFSPFFLSKYYLSNDIKKVIKKYNFTGDLLDFGCGSKPYKKYFTKVTSYKGIDFKMYSVNKGHDEEIPNYNFSETYLDDFQLNFEDESFDVVTAFQVLEHHIKPSAMINEIFRITKPGGYLLITAPFLGGLHEEPNDYQRFTKYGLKALFKFYNCEIKELLGQGSLFSTLAMLINEYINALIVKGGSYCFFGLILYIPMFPFQFSCLIFDKIFRTNKICFNYLILIKKLN